MKAFRLTFAAAFLVTLVAVNSFGSIVAATPGMPEPARLRWKGRVIRIAVSTSVIQPNTNIKTDSDVMEAIRRSLQAWQNATDIEFQLETSEKQSVSPAGVTGDGVSLITIAQSPENVLLFSKSPLSESAKTRVFYNGKGFITEADVVLNPFQQFSTDGTFGTFDLESTLTHEIGHLLGLRHSGIFGATMSDSLAKNGAFGSADFGPRTLAASDISAIRELYGGTSDKDDCCAAITGKLSLGAGRSTKNLRVWAEESKTGRVIAQAASGTDGSFRLGGLPAGTYSLFWQKKDDTDGSSIGELGSVKVENGETKSLNEKIVVRHSDIALNYVGINGRLADLSVPLSAGREYVLYLGGKNLDPKNINIDFNSPFFKANPASIMAQDFGDGVSVVSVVVSIDKDAPIGVYSIFATGGDGSKASLIGALSVQ